MTIRTSTCHGGGFLGVSAPLIRLLAAAAAATATVSDLSGADAQTAPRFASPGRIDQSPQPARQGPLASPAFAAERKADAPIRPFTLRSVSITGSTLPQAALEQKFAPFIGRMTDNPALTRLTEAVASAYPMSDVALYTVLVPQQRFRDGVLRLIVVEGYIESVRVDGRLRGPTRRILARYLSPLLQQRPLRSSSLQRRLSLIRDIPGLTVEPKLERGDRQGAVRLVLAVRQHALQTSLGANDRGTALLGRDQVEVDFYANGLLFGSDQLRAGLAVPTNPRLFQYYTLAYSVPMNADGLTAQANVSYLHTRPSSIPLDGSAVSAGLQISFPVIRSYSRNAYVTGSLDGVNSDNALLGQTLSNERTRSARLGGSYSMVGARNSFTASATASFGLNALGARAGAFGQSTPDYRKLNVKLLDTLQLGGDMVLRLDGYTQLSADRLPASEQAALGGDEFGQAYETAVISGDYGVAASAELAWRPAKGLPKPLAGSEVFTVVDAGELWLRDRGVAPTTRAQLASVGGGLRAQILNKSVVQIEAVRGLHNPVSYENRDVWRLLFSVRTLF